MPSSLADAAALARSADLQRWQAEFPDTVPIGSLQLRQDVVFVGVVYKIRLVNDKGIDVTVEDGTGRVTATWTGRTRLPGVELGGGLRLSGVVAKERDGTLRVRNPDWALVVEPYR